MTDNETERSDAELVAKALVERDQPEGENAYRLLVERYWKVVTVLLQSRLSTSRNVEDIAQETFIRAWRALPKLQNPHLFLGWLLRIAKNLATDYLRKERKELPLDSVEVGSDARVPWRSPASAHAEEALEQREEVAAVTEALRRLPEPYRTAITLRYMKDMSNQDLARVLDEPEGTIRNRVFRALRKLRQLIETQKVSN